VILLVKFAFGTKCANTSEIRKRVYATEMLSSLSWRICTGDPNIFMKKWNLFKEFLRRIRVFQWVMDSFEMSFERNLSE